MDLKRVVITGLGTVNPLGLNVSDFFDAMDRCESGAGLITRFDASLFNTRFACEVKNFNPEDFGISRKDVRRQDRFAHFALAAAVQAVEDSGIDMSSENPFRVGTILGSGIGGIETVGNEVVGFMENQRMPHFNPFFIPRAIANIASGWVSMQFGFMGPNYAVCSACSSSSHAVADAVNLIRLGKADIILSGGSEAPITLTGVGGFNAARALSTNNDEYMTACRPFDRTRDGFVIGEGAGVLVLEEMEHAKSRGAKIYAEIAGYAMSADAYHITEPREDRKGEIYVIKEALRDAGVSPEEVDYINVHGTSTQMGDVSELDAIKAAFGEAAYKVNLSSTKSMHGHLLGAAGAVESLACIHAIQDSIIPPTINFKEEDPNIDYKMNLTLNKPVKRKVNVALNNSFGFGGQNSCIVFRRPSE